jgi:hypothetical protein
VFQLRELKRDRHLSWIFEIGRRWDEEKLEQSRLAFRQYDKHGEDLAAKTVQWLEDEGHTNRELDNEMLVISRLPDFFEDVALMERFGHLHLGLVWESLSGPVQVTWKAWERSAHAFRDYADVEAYTQFEHLNDKLERYVPRPIGRSRLGRWVKTL